MKPNIYTAPNGVSRRNQDHRERSNIYTEDRAKEGERREKSKQKRKIRESGTTACASMPRSRKTGKKAEAKGQKAKKSQRHKAKRKKSHGKRPKAKKQRQKAKRQKAEAQGQKARGHKAKKSRHKARGKTPKSRKKGHATL